MLEGLVYCAMGVADPLLMVLGFKLLLTPVLPCGLKFVVREVFQHFHTDPRFVQNQDHLEAAAFSICFLKEHSAPSDRSLAYGFGLRKNEVAQMVRKGKWLIDTSEELKIFYENLGAKFANARWWELL